MNNDVSCSTSSTCCACGSIMTAGYDLCPECGTRQNAALRYTSYAINIFSGISVILGALTIILALYPQIIRNFNFRENLEVVSLNAWSYGGYGNFSVVNRGDGDVFLSKFVIEMKNFDLPFNINYLVHKTIRKGEMMSVNFDSSPIDSSIYIDTIGPNELKEWISARGSKRLESDLHYCFDVKPFDREKGNFMISPVLPSHPIRITTYYYSHESDHVVAQISDTPIAATIFRKAGERCKTDLV